MTEKSHSVTFLVDRQKLARAVGSGELEVLATPMMIAAMEQAASELLSQELEPGRTSVGTMMNVAHTAATPLGMEVTATAAITAREGKRVDFEVFARDARGEIGRGTHSRVVVDAGRFQRKADGKLGKG